MKNLTKIFFAVAAFVAYSCATDATEDLGVQLGNGAGQTVIELSLEESRTQLGEKAGDLYPVYWSEGDKISVNGIESFEASIDPENKAKAYFTVNGTLEAPYQIAYPAAPAGQVRFAAEQVHTENTFGDGVSTMYGLGKNAPGASLNHLTGVLKVGVTGNATITKAQISTVNHAPIAGLFDIDFRTGKLTPNAESLTTINYSFGDEGVALSSENPTYMHIAVPAGVYDELYITLFDIEGGLMYATVKAGASKPLAVGKVREFLNSITYTADKSYFVINDLASLQAFAAQATTLEKDVIFTNDIDLSEVEWTPIEGYAGTVHGNGYAIKGLKAPLFGTTNASIKGLNLIDVNINETVEPKVAALAKYIFANEANPAPVVDHCYTTGQITVNCTEFTPETGHKSIAIAGIVSVAEGVQIQNCVNDITIDIKQVAVSGNTQATAACVGGIVGFHNPITIGETTVVVSISNCENKGNISYVDNSYTGDIEVETESGTFPAISLWIGGVTGGDYSTTAVPNTGALAPNLTNRGDIYISGKIYDIFSGGLIGHNYHQLISDSYNYGDLTIKDTKLRRCFAGGVAGVKQASKINTAHNHGVVTVSNVEGREGYFGGVIGLNKVAISGCTNNAPLHVNFLQYDRTANYVAAKYYVVGGISGAADNEDDNITECTNNKEGKIFITGTVRRGSAVASAICFGGVVGRLGALVNKCYNKADIDLNVTTGTISGYTFTEQKETSVNVGGAVGFNAEKTHNNYDSAYNEGNITISGTYNTQLNVGGIVGHAGIRFGGINDGVGCTNKGTITISDEGRPTVFAKNGFIGGTVGFSSVVLADHTNYGDIIINKQTSNTTGELFISGIVAISSGQIARTHNHGDISVSGKYAKRTTIGGVVGRGLAKINNNSNNGAITITKDYEETSGDKFCLGGVVGVLDNKDISFEYCDNYGTITVESGAKINSECWCGAIAGYTNSSQNKYHNNYGTMNISGTYSKRFNFSGGVGYVAAAKLIEIYNHGTLNFNPNITNTGTSYISGIGGIIKGGIRNCENKGAINVSGNIGQMFIGGVLAWVNKGSVENQTVINSGDITIKSGTKCANVAATSSNDALNYGSPVIAGVAGYLQDAMNGCINSGNIVVEEGAEIPGQIVVAGCGGISTQTVAGCLNTGNITLPRCTNAETNVSHIGGIFGFTRKNAVSNSVANCVINAPDYKNVGMIAGMSSAVATISGCQIAGTIYKVTELYEEIGNKISYIPVKEDITTDNFFKYIYSDEVSKDKAASDQCSYYVPTAE